ncbi:IQ motif and ubiquitin-like domain-containing protein isoform X1 [Haliotis cracherodii]|uniref:IQ motif and ubiquitin-like domain-containing protein isoform X1 n=1 Tax=Haliotis cracherodii TaxID=6455 RepID=UPI0039E80685
MSDQEKEEVPGESADQKDSPHQETAPVEDVPQDTNPAPDEAQGDTTPVLVPQAEPDPAEPDITEPNPAAGESGKPEEGGSAEVEVTGETNVPVESEGQKEEVTKEGQKEEVTEGQKEVTEEGQKEEVTEEGQKEEVTEEGQKEEVTGQKEVTEEGQKEVTEGQKEVTEEGQKEVTEEGQKEVTEEGQKEEVIEEGQKEEQKVDEAEKTEQEPTGEEVKAENATTEEKAEVKDDVREQDKQELEDKPEVERAPSVAEVGTEMRKIEDEGVTLDGRQATPVKPTPSVKTKVNLDATATVKFVLMPSGQVVTLACTLGQTLQQLKEHFSSELKMPVNLILIMHDGKGISEKSTLADLGVGPNGTVQLEMQSADPVNTPIKSYRPRQEYHMPDVITVRVQGDDEEPRDIVVEIERSTKKKPFLGGFRHKTTGVEYHNASAQTATKPRPVSNIERYCRDTQTVQQRHQPQQTTNDTSTQMTKIGVFVSNMSDKLLIPGQYTTADDHLAMLLRKIIIIQKYYRRWLSKRYVHKLKQDKQRRLEWEKEEEIRKKKEKEDRIKKEFARRMNPKNKEDFDLLFHALEKWRQEEIERINTTLEGAERKAALCMLLDQETQLLAAIDRHKLEAGSENKDLRIQSFLEKAASPKKWKGHDGKVTEMDTPYTIRARELRDIYNSINMKYLTQDERLDVLLTLKHTVKEHDCKLTQEIIELIDREADLLMRGVKETNLDGLRKRISTLFLQYIKTPTFNPESAKLLKVPQDPSTLRKNIYFCPSCNSYLPSTEFSLSSNSRYVGKCRRCGKTDNDARVRQDFSHFRFMLKSLRKAEEGYGDRSQIAFLLQENDLQYLVENIWNSQSILSAWEDLYDLILVRWDKHDEWSPWNCVLLTKEEASAHDRLHSLEEGYGQVFIHKVKQKHTLARNYFSRLPGMAELIRKRTGKRDIQSNRGPSVAGTAVPVQQKA